MAEQTAGRQGAEKFVPLPETTVWVLAALLDSPKHGYAISKFVEECSEHTVRIAIGNLYVTLKRLLDQGLIEQDPTVQEDERRKTKTYRLTGLGSQVVNLEQVRNRRLGSALAGAGGAWQGAPG